MRKIPKNDDLGKTHIISNSNTVKPEIQTAKLSCKNASYNTAKGQQNGIKNAKKQCTGTQRGPSLHPIVNSNTIVTLPQRKSFT